MIIRSIQPILKESLEQFPVVGLVGARQVGKTTMARQVAREAGADAIRLDLERPSDQRKLADPELYLEQHRQHLVVLDEIQRIPELFQLLRALVDEDRRPGRFLVLGSASPDLLQGASESLAGRIRFLELGPLELREVGPEAFQSLWLRGGFPDSFLAGSNAASMDWRDSFIMTHLERDIPLLGLRLPPAQLRRFWQMIAHGHGGLWNASRLAVSLGISAPTVRRYLDVLEDTYMVRQLQPFHANLGKRLVKQPKVYVRDSGLLHALLGVRSMEDLLGNPSAGASWEGFVIEQILAAVPASWRPTFYRTSAGAELDLVLERPGNLKPLGIEVKLTKAPAPTRGFWQALEDIGAQGVVVCQATESYPLAPNATVLPIQEIQALMTLP
ncbi:MAG: ATP-binding protein [Holophaga sp.]|nr:ATP-binding protein [Holophaga sp.]